MQNEAFVFAACCLFSRFAHQKVLEKTSYQPATSPLKWNCRPLNASFVQTILTIVPIYTMEYLINDSAIIISIKPNIRKTPLGMSTNHYRSLREVALLLPSAACWICSWRWREGWCCREKSRGERVNTINYIENSIYRRIFRDVIVYILLH